MWGARTGDIPAQDDFDIMADADGSATAPKPKAPAPKPAQPEGNKDGQGEGEGEPSFWQKLIQIFDATNIILTGVIALLLLLIVVFSVKLCVFRDEYSDAEHGARDPDHTDSDCEIFHEESALLSSGEDAEVESAFSPRNSPRHANA